MRNDIKNSIFFKSMQVNHSRYGRQRDGYTRMIPEDGFSGTVGTTWGDDMKMMHDR